MKKTILRWLFHNPYRYVWAQKQAGLKPGDTVFVKRPGESFEKHWPYIWRKRYNAFVNAYWVVVDLVPGGVILSSQKRVPLPFFIMYKIPG